MPKISDTWKPGFSTIAAGKAFATGNYADGALNLALAFGQSSYAIGKNYLPKSRLGDKLGPKRGGTESLRDSFGVEAVILERGIQIVTAMTLLLGSGKEEGQTYEAASSFFDLAWENLKDAAVSGDSWSGESASTYNARNAEQMEWASLMAELDQQVAALLQQNSVTLGNCKITLTSVRAFYTVCIPIAATLRWAAGPAGPMISRWFQWAMFAIGMAVALPTLGMALARATQNGLALQKINLEYTGVATSAQPKGSDYTAPELAPAPKSQVGAFEQLDTTGSSAAASGGDGQRAVPAAGAPNSFAGASSASEGGSPQNDSAAESKQAAPQINIPPAYARQATSQVAGTPTTSAGAAKKAPGREAASTQEDLLGDHFEGAATGDGPGERAPVDSAVGAEQAQERVR